MAFGAQRFVALPGGLDRIRALVFDVFGTVVDWRGTLIRTGNLLNSHRGLDMVPGPPEGQGRPSLPLTPGPRGPGFFFTAANRRSG